jgi:para-nitrobenzyl esterase
MRILLAVTATTAVACGLAPPAGAAQQSSGPMTGARIESGLLAGVNEGDVEAFLGIPYAEPPEGSLRWRPPRSPAPWAGTRAADHFSASCMQRRRSAGPWTPEYQPVGPLGEDCLAINVWTPARTATERLAVMVWIHGGSFKSGSASTPIFDGRKLAARGIIVVTLNYRLGVLGFLAHPQLSAESAQRVSGNYGLMDIIAALGWVQRNIAAFGGDAQRVTLAGQSAGAYAVDLLEASPDAAALFHQAITESGSAGRDIRWRSLNEAQIRGARYLQALGLSSIDALRRVPASRLYAPDSRGEAAPDRSFPPIVDGVTIPGEGATDIAALCGFNADEHGSLRASMNRSGRLAAGKGARAVLVEWGRRRSARSSTPLYLYLYDHAEPGPDSATWGAFHGAELPYVFDTLDAAPDRPFVAVDREIAERIAGYWVNFVKTGTPNGRGLPQWPAFDAAAPAVMEIGDRFATLSSPH